MKLIAGGFALMLLTTSPSPTAVARSALLTFFTVKFAARSSATVAPASKSSLAVQRLVPFFSLVTASIRRHVRPR